MQVLLDQMWQYTLETDSRSNIFTRLVISMSTAFSEEICKGPNKISLASHSLNMIANRNWLSELLLNKKKLEPFLTHCL